MPINNPNLLDRLHIFILSVGQADTTVIVSPQGRVLVIDARTPAKILRLLNDIGLENDTIEHLIITHPHGDHFSGGNRLAQDLTIQVATLPPFWHAFGMGPQTYQGMVSRLADQQTKVNFLSGYTRWYPDLTFRTPPGSQHPEVDESQPFLEMLGPTNSLIEQLEEAKNFNANHLTIISRLNWREFRMISAGDAQMENWQAFDSEGLMESSCQVLRAAHHGSANGTQWERLDRISPRLVVVSSDPANGHHLPDLISAATFQRFDKVNGQTAVITSDTGTIHIEVSPMGTTRFEMYKEGPDDFVDLGNPQLLDMNGQITDWIALLNTRFQEL